MQPIQANIVELMVPYFGSHLSITLFYPAKVDTPYTFNRVSLAGSLLGPKWKQAGVLACLRYVIGCHHLMAV